MITIANRRAEKAARRLARTLGTTISEAVAVACERLLNEHDAAGLAKRRRERLDRVPDDIWKRHRRPSEAERARLADHRTLYDRSGLPRRAAP